MITLKPLKWGGKPLKIGDHFIVQPHEAHLVRMLTATKHARINDSGPEETKDESKRTYKRRDMKAER